MLALPRSHLHYSELVQCASACRIATRLLAKRIVVSWHRKTSWTQTRTSFARTGRLVAGRAAHCCATLWTSPFQNMNCEADIHGFEELVNSGLSQLGHACIQYLRVCFASGGLGSGRAGTLISGFRRYVLLARSCGADLEDRQSVFRTILWSLAIQAEFRTPVSHEIVLSMATSAWLHNVPEPFVSLFAASGRRQAASMVRRGNFWWITVNTLGESLWHRQHQRSQNARNGRSCNSTTRASWTDLESLDWSTP